VPERLSSTSGTVAARYRGFPELQHQAVHLLSWWFDACELDDCQGLSGLSPLGPLACVEVPPRSIPQVGGARAKRNSLQFNRCFQLQDRDLMVGPFEPSQTGMPHLRTAKRSVT